MPLDDADARLAAMDPDISACVSAPAGSGKTSLLVQRFLALLPRVDAAESVVAITFTRKAAAEMRARILNALQEAAAGEEGASDHERALLATAREALRRSEEQGWDLTANPTRLSIQTIDSFCGDLTRQMPVLSGSGGPLSATDDAGALCELAVERFFQRLLGGRDASAKADLQSLLLHLDNRWDSAVSLLVQLLQRREQWQAIFGARGLDAEERPVILGALEDLTEHRLLGLRCDLEALRPELDDAIAWRAENAPQLPAIDLESPTLSAWRPLADLLLTKAGSWRRSVNKNDGFPAGKGEAAEHKARFLALLSELAAGAHERVRDALVEVRLMPLADAQGQHWEVLLAITRLLPSLSAELMLVFREQGSVDHAQIAMGALAALGTDDQPTDLALRLDNRIEHLLVDEFQDTSSLQFELIRRLTRGWAEHNENGPGAPRTLHIVGDPMQSIYGFREANVGLFLQARDSGIGTLHLEPIELTVNFRSTHALVEWSNHVFKSVFPQTDDAERGAVRHRPARAAQTGGAEPEVRLYCGEGAEAEEIEALCDAVEEGLTDPTAPSLAILGRSRGQLRPILAALRGRGMLYAAQDFDPLASHPVVRDLHSLTAALLDPFDRYSWLCLLRTPTIALDNADLLAVTTSAPTAVAFREVFQDGGLPKLSNAAERRMKLLGGVLIWAEHYRDRLAPRVWIEEAWLRLGGAAAFEEATGFEEANAFFKLLEGLGRDPRGLLLSLLEDALRSTYAEAASPRARVQVMTLHKAKGLEFDRVYIPALGRGTRRTDQPLLRWDEVTLPGRPPAVLLDVRDAVGGSSQEQLYAYLKHRQDRRAEHEAARLLYVGCTRAKSALWLSGCLAPGKVQNETSPPRAGSLLAHLWRGLGDDPGVLRRSNDSADDLPELKYERLQISVDAPPIEESGFARGLAYTDNRGARSRGVAVHRVLEALVYGQSIPERADDALSALLRVTLHESGTEPCRIEDEVAKGIEVVDRCLTDPWLRWALDPARKERRAEFGVSLAVDTGEIRSLVVDYSFVDEARGERWVVDYKTAAPAPGETLDGFLQEQADRYTDQLSAYATALGALGPEAVRCALYFPALGLHHPVHLHQPV